MMMKNVRLMIDCLWLQVKAFVPGAALGADFQYDVLSNDNGL